jgi:hypothetical protein
MPADIPEADWRRFREVRKRPLERHCDRILQEVTAASSENQGTAHERYLRVCKLIQDRDKETGQAFDDFRRSTAILQMGIMRKLGLLTDGDLAEFSDQIQERVRGSLRSEGTTGDRPRRHGRNARTRRRQEPPTGHAVTSFGGLRAYA